MLFEWLLMYLRRTRVILRISDAVRMALPKTREIDIEGCPPLKDKKFILVTAHRRESFGEPFRNICLAIKEIVDQTPDIEVIYPVHLNPNVQKPVQEILSSHPRIHLLKPLSYLPFLKLMNACHLVLTDSGGLQEEAPSLNKPVLVMREVTERPEGIEAGVIRLVGTEREQIVKHTVALLQDPQRYEQMANAANPYGDGYACQRIVTYLESVLTK